MYTQFFTLSMVAPARQLAFRRAVVFHALLASGLAVAVMAARGRADALTFAAHTLLVAGIVEGAMLVGWRLSQLPKSQSLEFLLVSPMQPRRIFLAEAAVGLARLALVTLAGLPPLVLLVYDGRIEWTDVPVLLVMPFGGGVITGLTLTFWAYEPPGVRRVGEAVALVLILFYLVVGVLLAERLGQWLPWLFGDSWGANLRWFVVKAVAWSPFDVLQTWLTTPAGSDGGVIWERFLGVHAFSLALAAALLTRAAFRLHGHFHDRHYRPVHTDRPTEADRIGDRPLSWWAVKRVMEYSGRINLYLAGGFGLLYAAYVLAGPYWPPWLGRAVFMLFDRLFGGIAGVSTGLVVLAAVPAAFQYGLWDSNVQDRCKRLELLLLTDLDAKDFYHAAAAAALRRGRGYFAVAVVMWVAALAAWWTGGPQAASPVQVAGAASAAVLLWAFSFTVGFRAFATGAQANGLGSMLTLGLPVGVYALMQADLPWLAALLPPGSVYLAMQPDWPNLIWVPGPLAVGVMSLWLSRRSLARCDADLRRWYDQNQRSRASD